MNQETGRDPGRGLLLPPPQALSVPPLPGVIFGPSLDCWAVSAMGGPWTEVTDPAPPCATHLPRPPGREPIRAALQGQAQGMFTRSLDCLNPKRNVVGLASRPHEPGGLGH